MLPLIHEAFINFCKKKKFLIPFLDNKDEDDNSVIGDITTLTSITIELGDEVQTDTQNKKGKWTRWMLQLKRVRQIRRETQTREKIKLLSLITALSVLHSLEGHLEPKEASIYATVTDMNMQVEDNNNTHNKQEDDDDSNNTLLMGLAIGERENISEFNIIDDVVERTKSLTLIVHQPNESDDHTVILGFTIDVPQNNKDYGPEHA
eukprot:11672005-Ditylum_brightwellii.AAC.1